MRIMMLFAVVSLILSGCASMNRPVRVGLLVDDGPTDAKSREAVWRIVSSTRGIEARRVMAEEVRAGALEELDVFILPGGTGSGEARALGVDGSRTLREFVHRGGGMVAICAGGYAVVEGWTPETRELELLNGKTWDDAHWQRGMRYITVELIGESSGTDAAQRTMWFENGPIFVPWGRDDMPAYTPLVRYVTDMAGEGAPSGMMAGRDAVVAAPFGEGKLVVFGPHPELSPGLEHWLRNAIQWTARGNVKRGISIATVLGER